jgi:hypothetical protein
VTPDSVSPEVLLATARAEAGRGEWGAVCARLEAKAGASMEITLLLAEAYLRTGQLTAAHTLLGSALAGGAERANTATHRRAMNMRGAAAFELGLLAEAELCFREAVALATPSGDPLTLGRATNNLGMIAHLRGAFDGALALYQLAVPAYQRLGFTAGLAETFHNMALAFRELGDLEAADRHERRAIEFAREAGDGRLLAIAQVGRADLALRRGEAEVAQAGARLGAQQYAAIPDAVGEADALRLVGAASVVLGEAEEAATVLARALGLARTHRSLLIEAEIREAQARLHAALGQWTEVAHDVAEARRLYRELGAPGAEESLDRWYDEAVSARG